MPTAGQGWWDSEVRLALMLLPVGTAHAAPVLCSATPKLLSFSHLFSPSPLQAQIG